MDINLSPGENYGGIFFADGSPMEKSLYMIPNLQGFFGIMMKRETCKEASKHFYEYFSTQPVDWLYGRYMIEHRMPLYRAQNPLFEHRAQYSSKEWVQKVEDNFKNDSSVKSDFITKEYCKWMKYNFLFYNASTFGIHSSQISPNFSISFLEFNEDVLPLEGWKMLHKLIVAARGQSDNIEVVFMWHFLLF
jgi:hypothetical protein